MAGVPWSERRHWKVVNVSMRVFGLMGLVIGMIAAIDGVILLRDPKAFDMEPMRQTLTGSFIWDLFGISAFTLAVGILFMIAQPYRPDLYEPDETKLKAQCRSWWTGEPIR